MATRTHEDAEEVVINRVEQIPLRQLAPALGMQVQDLLSRLKADAFVVEDPEASIEQLAEKHNTDTDEILQTVFLQYTQLGGE